MPITNTQQARVDLSQNQYTALAGLFQKAANAHQAMVSIEETNIENTVAFITKRGTSLVHHDGTVTPLGRGATSDLG